MNTSSAASVSVSLSVASITIERSNGGHTSCRNRDTSSHNHASHSTAHGSAHVSLGSPWPLHSIAIFTSPITVTVNPRATKYWGIFPAFTDSPSTGIVVKAALNHSPVPNP